MTLFADYEPEAPRRALPDDLVLRDATALDLPALAALRAARGDASLAEAREAFERQVGRGALVVVAVTAGVPVAYGVAEQLALEALPKGWYLTGVVVSPSERRRGIAGQLTRHRLAWIGKRATEAFYFVNEVNRVSIDLHAGFGFEPIAHDIRVPGVTFQGGRGVLYRAAFSDAGESIGPA